MTIPENFLTEWQSIIDIITRIAGTRVGLIMRIRDQDIEVMVASSTPNNPYHVKEKEHLHDSGLYCEEVIKTHDKLLVANALKSDKWDHNPDLKHKLISYLGFPIKKPDGRMFGTICLLDDKENQFSNDLIELMDKMRNMIEGNLILEYKNVENAREITERKKNEEALKVSEEKFSKAFHNSTAIMTISRLRDGVCIDVNNTWASTLGYEREEMIGRTASELNYWADPAQRKTMYEQLSKEGYLNNFESKYRKKSGDIGYTLSSVNIINMNGEEHVMVTAIDITERKRYKEEMSRLENLNIIGQMSASIAHEIRNPMTSLRGFLQMFRSQDKYQDDYEIMDLMVEELDRVNDIITDFLTLAQKKHIDVRLHSLKDDILTVLPIIKADAIKNNIIVRTELRDVDQIMIGEGEIRQLVLNLVRNGIDAISGGGEITLKTFKDDNGVNLLVEDTGHGIPSEVLDKIGTPFLTTKKNGTGLGMTVCYSIAERRNAKITVDTSSEGTSFKVTFPIPIAKEDEVVA